MTTVDTACPSHVCSLLLVDDDRATREMVTVALRSEGYEVEVSRNGRDALQILRSRVETCAILLDLQLPLVDGSQFRAAQLRDRSLAWIPVIVISGVPGAHQEAERLGAAAFLPKPVDLDRLRDALARLACPRRTPLPERIGRRGTD